MSRSFTNGAIKGHKGCKWAKKKSNRVFRQKSKKDPEGVTNSKREGWNTYKFPSNHGQDATGFYWCNYKSFSK